MRRKVLLTVLDWGLGHATRSVPIIRALLELKCEVVIGGAGDSLRLLQVEFPFLRTLTLPAYNPRYPSATGSMTTRMIMQLPRFMLVIRNEQKIVDSFVRRHGIDLIISDNRYGAWSRSARSVFITHQSNILMPRRFGWMAGPVRWCNRRLVSNFDVCWIPDYPGEQGWAGDLANFGDGQFHPRLRYIGPLSRFASAAPAGESIDFVAICSGPEPQRTYLEQVFRESFAGWHGSFLIIRGVVSGTSHRRPFHSGFIVDFLSANNLQAVLESARFVIGRSGYSSIMDYYTLRKRAIFIPTPGQTEQEYLAKRLDESGVAMKLPQMPFSPADLLRTANRYSGFSYRGSESNLQPCLSEVLQT